MKKENQLLNEFKAFALRGNVLDMAIGVIIASAFGKITTVLVNDIFMPLFSFLFGNLDFSQWNLVISQAVVENGEVVKAAIVIGFGQLVSAVVNFLLIAIVVFALVKVMNGFKKKEESLPEAPKGPTSEELLSEILTELKKR